MYLFFIITVWLYNLAPCVDSNMFSPCGTMVSEPMALIEDLTPGVSYQFRVSAHNQSGISLPSEASEFVTISATENSESPSCMYSRATNYSATAILTLLFMKLTGIFRKVQNLTDALVILLY